MSLTYRYSFSASEETTPEKLEKFLKSVEIKAKALGFNPTTVLNILFDNPERREFSRRLGGSCVIEDERLKGDIQFSSAHVWHHHSGSGTVRLVPERGVVLVITDKNGSEVCLGFMKFPGEIHDASGRMIMPTPFKNRWVFRDFINSPDPRYRDLIQLFADAGYLESESDDFNQAEPE